MRTSLGHHQLMNDQAVVTRLYGFVDARQDLDAFFILPIVEADARVVGSRGNFDHVAEILCNQAVRELRYRHS